MAGEGAAAAAAAAKRKLDQDREEEEEVTPLNSDPSGAVEYKILRSTVRTFRKPAKFRAAVEGEARAGWELVEKLDDQRIRLRRSIAWRQRDGELDQDPYRTRVGMSEGVALFWVLLGTAVVVGSIFGLMNLLLPT